ncbi:MAG: FAD-dependent thymidylate synthase [Clostridiales bacterium]|jgi:thymidylate synthase (FAD)|nr:FAD-dependent thymidylate synthase [Clostridiales bacterium]
MKVTLLAYTPEPERVVAAAAKTCYAQKGLDTLWESLEDAEETARFVGMLEEIGHESPVEHASFTFAIEGVSRSLLAQLTRHRIASYSVRSQRYVSEKRFGYVTPPSIAEDPEAMAIYEEAMAADQAAYEKLTALLAKKALPEFEAYPDAKTRARKKAQEDARFVLPNACQTQLVVTMNARSLYNFFRHRCCNRAQWEIRALADEMLREVKKVAPRLFAHCGPPCVYGACPEGKMSCGKAEQMREKYTNG